MCNCRIVGIGTPHGDDQLGWRLIERLASNPPPRAALARVRHPLELLETLRGCRVAILMDACQTGAAPGTPIRLEWPDARIVSHQFHSSHGLSLAETLELAQRLGRLPERVILLGIEVASCQPGSPLSPSVEAALPGLLEQARWEIEQAREANCHPHRDVTRAKTASL